MQQKLFQYASLELQKGDMYRVRTLYRDLETSLNGLIFKDKWELLVAFPGNLPWVFSALHSARVIPVPKYLYDKKFSPKRAWLSLTKYISEEPKIRAISHISNKRWFAKQKTSDDGLLIGLYVHDSPIIDSELITPFTYNLEAWSDFSLDDVSHSVERMVGTSPSPGDFNVSDIPQSEAQGVFFKEKI